MLTSRLEEVIPRNADDMLAECRGVDHLGNKVIDGLCTKQPHVHLELIPEDLDRPLDTLLAVRAERVQERPADTDCLGTKSDGLENIRGTTDTTVNEDLELGVGVVALEPEGSDDFDEDFDTGAGGIELTTTVVGEDDTLHANLVCKNGILCGGNTLENDGHWRIDKDRC